MGQRSSVATIDKPEFINVQSVSRYIAKCQIKVLYIGENRNNSVISKEVATKMAQTLPGCPIVGWYKEDVGDFRDHGNICTTCLFYWSISYKIRIRRFITSLFET